MIENIAIVTGVGVGWIGTALVVWKVMDAKMKRMLDREAHIAAELHAHEIYAIERGHEIESASYALQKRTTDSAMNTITTMREKHRRDKEEWRRREESLVERLRKAGTMVGHDL
jgi:hypothetical protein